MPWRAEAALVVLGIERWRVRLGPFAGAMAVQRARDAVQARGYGGALVLAQD